MPSTVEICNLALDRIGIAPINDINGKGVAEKCKTEYYPAKISVLRDHPWNFATRIEPLAPVSGVTAPGWSYVYIYPKVCEFVRNVFNAATMNGPKQPYRVIGSNSDSNLLILCNLEQAYMEYTADVQDPSLFDGSFVDALAWNLAAKLAFPLVGDANLGTKLLQSYQLALKQAKINNASEGYQEQPKSSKYIDGR